jgi:hypothetical protein
MLSKIGGESAHWGERGSDCVWDGVALRRWLMPPRCIGGWPIGVEVRLIVPQDARSDTRTRIARGAMRDFTQPAEHGFEPSAGRLSWWV